MRALRMTAAAFAVALAFSVVAPLSASAATTSVSTFTELQSAIGSAVAGDVIELENDIVVTSTLTLSAGVTIDGQGYALSVPTPGVTEAGLNAASPSTFRIFTITSSSLVTIRDVTILGGNAVNGGALYVTSGASSRLEGVRLERSRNSFGGGGAVYNAGSLRIEDSFLRRNSARWGGGVINATTGLLVMINSTLAENRTEDADGGGGGVENQGTMWLLNSTFAHNLTTAGGGAINNYKGTLQVAHSTFVGNVSTGPYDGGAILSFSGGNARVVSSLFAYNYSRRATPAGFVLDDFSSTVAATPLSQPASITIASSLVHTADSWPAAINDSDVTDYAGAMDGSDDTLFSGGSYSYPTGGTGTEITTFGKVYRPNLFVQDGLPTAALVSLTTPGLSGAPVEFVPTSTFAYYSSTSSSWVSLVGTASGAATVTTDQIGAARNASGPTVGALEGTVAPTFLVSSPVVSGGSVTGASAYGDPYPAGTNVSVTAIPDAGFSFTGWSIQIGSAAASSSSANPLPITVSDATVVTPSFAVASAGERTVTYSGFAADSGAPPTANTSTSTITIAASGGTLARAGYAVTGWNTSSNGSGTAYVFSQDYAAAANLTLYPVWAPVTATAVTFDSQGGSSVASDTSPAGGTVAAPAAPVRSGYAFMGWATAPAGSAVTFPYAPGAVSSITLYALWTQLPTSGGGSAGGTLGVTGQESAPTLGLALGLVLTGVLLLGMRRRRHPGPARGEPQG